MLVPVPKGRMGVAHQLALGSPHKSGERRDRAAKALSVHFSSVQLRPTLCDPMNRSMRHEDREPLADKTWESTLLSRSGGVKGLTGSGAVNFGVSLE